MQDPICLEVPACRWLSALERVDTAGPRRGEDGLVSNDRWGEFLDVVERDRECRFTSRGGAGDERRWDGRVVY